ncbi:L-proline dehydrogenase /delta-1-pyrroline-5-carboxylate dehydrogenase [Oryzisolibacter propanilivorax]|uniref:Bifunctional protein PutA n=1 Tax=Oryzisolibacter propanilivorax TaxID=1527607 RepID=A0A1G9U9M6_9BURK|nr:trifunctional transcriptional regulator/proline dehydrogenase/L-glutamate gamma-semialdehyde dehydrogenase [Oryzisolibacter propanilivorax]SDM56255.1 L-proline dehydrogenase /delta-1-pyrroline-5-carboxylate dehydrogenase [Oryzisolibacter propanilivorax]
MDTHAAPAHDPHACAAAAQPAFFPRPPDTDPLRRAITAACRPPEPAALAPLLAAARLPPALQQAVQERALALGRGLREREQDGGRAGLVQALLQQFALSSHEGVALMCLAEALLRIPDAATRDALIRDKVGSGDWAAHLGRSPSLFVNAATWGLLLTGRLVATHSESGLKDTLRRLTARGGEPLIRKGVDVAMRLMGEQFVTGQTIAEALARAQKLEARGFRHSYDMLGEAALTADDAARYQQAYVDAIHAIGRASAGRGVYDGPGISIKLSALHPRYQMAQWRRVMDELYPRLLSLAQLARQYGIGLNIDAEEADRLELSLDLLKRLCAEPSLAGFDGIGFVVQAYQKRCPAVLDWLVALARRSGHRLMVRLVKGAYWDSEIKRAQVEGLADYPVYTRKAHTDVAYLACAQKLLAAPDAIYPQFATHNAQTLASVREMAGPQRWQPGQYEFQCLHGMGEPLYEQVVPQRPCRIYAPVGTHETLLAYLVRRLLENGANTSFVNRVADAGLPLEALVEDPVAAVDAQAAQDGGVAGLPHPRIPLPRALYGAVRANARGWDLASPPVLRALEQALGESRRRAVEAAPLVAQAPDSIHEPNRPLAHMDHRPPAIETIAKSPVQVRNPADHADCVGQVREAEAADVDAALAAAVGAQPLWAATPATERAALLRTAADRLEAEALHFLPLLVREAGKTAANAVAELREAVDFLRYYAAQVEAQFDNAGYLPLGPVACISPWNFPLAIFVGQVAAALAAGNVVLAKPAEQTPLVAHEAVRLLHAAGIPRGALQLLPGAGDTVGTQLVADARVQGVLFTGSTEVARLLQRTLAQRLGAHGQPVPLVAETGGQNALIVDSSALPEQVVADVLASAFDSAGQRCSALRVLCLQQDGAERTLAMLRGALAELRVGDPARLATDVGPVIDAEAQGAIQDYIARRRATGRRVLQGALPADTERGTFVPPTLIELDRVAELGREVFGPVLHVVRYAQDALPTLLAQINATGYGLTQGLHTRIDETVARVAASACAGNLYVNRNLVGAVVGVQPFGGEGLSGTGPKAGGPLYLLRLLAAYPPGAARAAIGHTAAQPVQDGAQADLLAPLRALQVWLGTHGEPALAQSCAALAAASCAGLSARLPGPTGERNDYHLPPRAAVPCLAEPASDAARLRLLASVLAVGASALWPADAGAAALRAALPAAVQARITLVQDWRGADIGAVLLDGDDAHTAATLQALAERPGALVGLARVRGLDDALAALPRLVLERALSVNTAAAGGNASLMTLA